MSAQDTIRPERYRPSMQWAGMNSTKSNVILWPIDYAAYGRQKELFRLLFEKQY